MHAIDEMVREITRELFLEAATAEVMEARQEGGAGGEAAAGDPDAILHRVVAARIEELDGTFLCEGRPRGQLHM